MKKLKQTETLFAIFLVSIPAILMISANEVRPSISDYAYSSVSDVFALLLGIAGTMFFYNGKIRDKWYNVVLGICLFVVAITPHNNYPILHYSAATMFFIGSVSVMIIGSSPAQRLIKILLGFVIILALGLHFVFDLFSLLYAEWIGMLPISLHFILESHKKFD